MRLNTRQWLIKFVVWHTCLLHLKGLYAEINSDNQQKISNGIIQPEIIRCFKPEGVLNVIKLA